MSKTSYKIFSLIFSLFILIFSFNISPVKEVFAEGKTITVYSWEDYIDDGTYTGNTDILDDFEDETGIHVEYYTFSTCEEMYNELIKDPNCCDLLCPSEYMIMKMRSENLIKKFDFTDMENYQNISPYIRRVFKTLDLADDTSCYAIGYMWGTLGFLYNMDKISEEALNHWNAIWDSKYTGRVTIKDSLRDTYFMVLARVYEEELMELKGQFERGEIPFDGENGYSSKIAEIFNRTDDDTISLVEDALLSLKDNLFGFEVDSGKSDIQTGKIDINLAWSGDAVNSMFESDDEGGVTLGYVVPEEGSNVWFDGWVMPKSVSGEQEEYAKQFIDYLCRPESAVRNMEAIGYTSVVGGEDVLEYINDCYGVEEGEYEIDLTYFFDEDFFSTGVSNPDYVITTDTLGREFSAQYPDYEIIKRCGVMDNFSPESLVKLNEMWSKVQMGVLSDVAIIMICVVILLVVIAIIIYRFKDKIFKFNPDKKIKIKKSKYKIISKEMI